MKDKVSVTELSKAYPKPHTLYDIHKEVEPTPDGGTEINIARWCVIDSDIKFETWDLSRYSEEAYSRKAYMWRIYTENKEEVEKLKKKILKIEKNYKSKVKAFRVECLKEIDRDRARLLSKIGDGNEKTN